MIMSEQTIPIPGRLKNVAIGGHVAGSEDIDAGGGKTQKQVNDETNDTLALHQSEISGLNSQNYVSVSTYSSLPATGSEDTIYRVSNYDGSQSQVAADVYSEYAWDGTQYVFLCVKSAIGEVFDISAYHNNVKYADLNAALTSNTGGVPQSLQKGGMSVKFVQSSDNKYVQYRLMNQNWSTTISDWQGVDDEPTAGSDNLVKSGGAAKSNIIQDRIIAAIEGVNIIEEPTSSSYMDIPNGANAIKITNISATSTWQGYITCYLNNQQVGYLNLSNGKLSDSPVAACFFLLSNGADVELADDTIIDKIQLSTTGSYTSGQIKVQIYNNIGNIISDLNQINEELPVVEHNATNAKNTLFGYTNTLTPRDSEKVLINEVYSQFTLKNIQCQYSSFYLMVYNGSTMLGYLTPDGVVQANPYIYTNITQGKQCSWNYPQNTVFTSVAVGSTGSFPQGDIELTLIVDSTLERVETLEEKIDADEQEKEENIYNHVKDNKNILNTAVSFIKNEIVDEYNRCVISFNGDSIIGSQLADITKSAGYSTGDFPPNMSKMIMARQFLDRYQFANADVVYRNITHSDWIKTGFNVKTGWDTPNPSFPSEVVNFNEIETNGCASADDVATITVTGYQYFKLVWSQFRNQWECDVNISIDGGAFQKPSVLGIDLPDIIGRDSVIQHMTCYKVCELDNTKTYVVKITPSSNYADVCFWGCEMWNNKRLDVVVEAFSGYTSVLEKARMIDSYGSSWHKPFAIITDVLASNDSSYVKQKLITIADWLEANSYLYNHAKELGIAMLAFVTHGNDILVKGARGLAQMHGLGIIDISKKLEYVTPVQSIVNTTDGVHLSNYGQTYYFDELKKIFD